MREDQVGCGSNREASTKDVEWNNVSEVWIVVSIVEEHNQTKIVLDYPVPGAMNRLS